MMKRVFIISAIMICSFSFVKPGMTEGLSGKDIMEMSFDRYDGDDRYFKVEMTLTDKTGDKRKRLLEFSSKEYGDLIKTFLEFTEPADIKGTAFLSLENETGDDTQYLFLPAVGRARRIVSSQKNLRFVNTDFTYEDMQRRRPNRDRHRLSRKEIYNGYECFVVKSVPKEKKNSQYSKRVHWVDRRRLVVLKTEFYGKRGDKIKEFRVESLERIQGIWTLTHTVMEDLKDRHTTTMKFLETQYNRGLDDEIFTQRNLEER